MYESLNLVCSECQSKEIEETSKEVYCKRCGYVIDQSLIDFSDDDSSFDKESERITSRVGKPWSWLDGSGHSLPPTEVGFKGEITKLFRKRI